MFIRDKQCKNDMLEPDAYSAKVHGDYRREKLQKYMKCIKKD